MAEPDLRSLYEWIDTQFHNAGGRRGTILGVAIGGSAVLCGGAISILLAVLHTGPAIGVALPCAVFLAAGLSALGWFFLSRSPAERALAKAVQEMQRVWFRLLFSRWSGNVQGLMGSDGARVLNDAANQVLRCRAAIGSAGWQAVKSDSPYARSRDVTATSMQTAMVRLVTMIGSGVPADDPKVVDLANEMRQSADEAESTAARLAEHRGLPNDAATDLRSALSEMRELNKADDEYSQIQA